MKVTFLGTSSGAPTMQRNVSATAIQPEEGKDWILVDCGEATQHQLLHSELSPQKLRAILITHIHGDHCYGLPGLLASCQLNGRTDALTIIGPEAALQYLRAVMVFTQLHINFPLQFIALDRVSDSIAHMQLFGQLDIHVSEASESGARSLLSVAGFDITAWPLNHRVDCWGYRLEENNVPLKLDIERLRRDGIASGPHFSRLQKGLDAIYTDANGVAHTLNSQDYTWRSWAARIIVIAGDNDTPECLRAACNQADLLIHEATYTEDVLDKVGPGPGHSCARQVASFAEKQDLKALILTHFSSRYLFRATKPADRCIDEIEQEARSVYAGDLFMAEDLARFSIDREGRVTRDG